jgi:hypothetical protein
MMKQQGGTSLPYAIIGKHAQLNLRLNLVMVMAIPTIVIVVY